MLSAQEKAKIIEEENLRDEIRFQKNRTRGIKYLRRMGCLMAVVFLIIGLAVLFAIGKILSSMGELGKSMTVPTPVTNQR
jgi:hypothetical protein